MKPNMLQQQRTNSRTAFTMIELVVAASILIALMSVVTSLTFRIHRVWKDSNQQRTATWALAGEMERLTTVPTKELPTQLSQLQASDELRDMLPNPLLSGELVSDSLGQRIDLSLNWDRDHPGVPVELVAWTFEQPLPSDNDDAKAAVSETEETP